MLVDRFSDFGFPGLFLVAVASLVGACSPLTCPLGVPDICVIEGDGVACCDEIDVLSTYGGGGSAGYAIGGCSGTMCDTIGGSIVCVEARYCIG